MLTHQAFIYIGSDYVDIKFNYDKWKYSSWSNKKNGKVIKMFIIYETLSPFRFI